MKDYSNSEFNGCKFVREIAPEVSVAGNKRRVAIWECYCGKEFQSAINNVTSGQVKSCGCKRISATAARSTKHGHSPMRNGANRGGTKLYRFWQSMKDRCLNMKSVSYKHYGGRGINMYEPWQNSFETFRGWFNERFGLDDVPSDLTMDRKNNNGNYAPDNLRLASLTEQANNRRNNHVISYLGERFTLSQLARKIGMKPGTLSARIGKQKLTIEQAIL